MTFKPESFHFIKEWVKNKSGIVLEGKEVLVDCRLAPLVEQHKLADLEGLVSSIKLSPESPLAIKILEALTTNETFWFRDLYPFEIVRTKIIPEILETKKNAKSFRFWSAACSMGQEAYSIALLLKQHYPQMNTWNVEILGSDLSSPMIEKAIAGIYDQTEATRGLPPLYFEKFFEPSGSKWKIVDSIKNNVTFKVQNLTQPFNLPPDLDLIFMRYVLIYFDAATKRAILQKAIQCLRPGGYLFLGSAETLHGMDLPMESIMGEKTIYYKKPLMTFS